MLLQLLSRISPVLRRSLHQTQIARKRAVSRLMMPAAALFIPLAGMALLVGAPDRADARRDSPGVCEAAERVMGQAVDAGSALQACLDQSDTNGIVALSAGRYLIATPLHLRHAMTLTTRGSTSASPACAVDERRCAVLHLAIDPAKAGAAVMPFDIDGTAIKIDRIVFEGTRRSDPQLSAARCAADAKRPLAGGLRVNGSDHRITRSVFRDMACYTALEFGGGTATAITDNSFLQNGTHTAALRWADGLTVHGGIRLQISRNIFRDNTDVQLIFGGCAACEVRDNRFYHSDSAAGGSFAELMLHAWPGATTGDFTGTNVTGNSIDCGRQPRCGFGIMIGAAPWYDAPTFGGTVTGNQVRGAMVALNIDRLTGPMRIEDNNLASVPGTYSTACGRQRFGGAAANISPTSREYFRGTVPAGATSVHYCIINFAATALPDARSAP